MNKHGVSRRWFTEAHVKHFKSGALGTITNITRSVVNCKKELLRWCILKILFIDTEKLSKMQISSQVFSKDFFDRFRSTYFLSECNGTHNSQKYLPQKWISLKLFFENFVDRFQNSYQSKN